MNILTDEMWKFIRTVFEVKRLQINPIACEIAITKVSLLLLAENAQVEDEVTRQLHI